LVREDEQRSIGPWRAEEPTRLDGSMPLVDAMMAMNAAGSDHAVVMADGEVVGLFAVTDLKRVVAEGRAMPDALLPLGPIAHRAVRCAPDDDLGEIVKLLRQNFGAVLFPSGKDGDLILTTDSLLVTLSEAAEPFLVIAEIERAIREVIADRLTAGERRQAFQELFARRRGGAPSALDDLSMGDYGQIIGAERLWPRFQSVFGSLEMTLTRLDQVRLVRNRLFHFSGIIEPHELRELARQRWWFVDRLQFSRRTPQGRRGLSVVD
jgi:CBS domain-containing protein